MSENTEEQITQNVLDSMAQTPNPRLKMVMTRLIRHLHAFIREVELTEEEWMTGIQFLTRTGQMCDDKRQEFILLSDTPSMSMLVDAINHPSLDGATESTVFGPFYRVGAEELPMGATHLIRIREALFVNLDERVNTPGDVYKYAFKRIKKRSSWFILSMVMDNLKRGEKNIWMANL